MSEFNLSPNFTQALIKNGYFSNIKINVIDIGARGGIPPYFAPVEAIIKNVGFEANKLECERLNKLFKNWEFINGFVWKEKSKKKFYITKFSASCGLYPPDEQFWKRTDGMKNLEVVDEIDVETDSLSNFISSSKIKDFDFMKLDVEGAELDVMVGGLDTVDQVIAVETEVRFFRCNKGCSVFSEVDEFLRKKGFSLFDIEIHKYQRNTLPYVSQARNEHGEVIPGATLRGQVGTGNALYIRDFLNNNEKNIIIPEKILKAIIIFELFLLNDCAIELLEKYYDQFLNFPFSFEKCRDLLTPQFQSKNVTYQEYLNSVNSGKDPNIPSTFSETISLLRRIKNKHLPARLSKLITKIYHLIK